MELNIVGGTYIESCVEPLRRDLFGSGLRAAAALSGKGFEIVFHSAVGKDFERIANLKARTFDYDVNYSILNKTVEFSYYHPLSKPFPLNLLENSVKLPSLAGKNILFYGLIEAEVKVDGDYVVYDPQNHISFSETNSTANHLALILNKNEALLMCGFPKGKSLKELGEILLTKESAEVVVIKNGSKGALVVEESRITEISVYETEKVWPIGSGDIFSAVFAWKWIIEKLPPNDSAISASKYTALFCDFQRLPLPVTPPIYRKRAIERKKKRIYLASPFFTIGERFMLNEIRESLLEFDNIVFSPFHDSTILNDSNNLDEIKEVAKEDLAEIDNCDVLLALPSGLDCGTIFEIGYAVAKNKKVLILAENIKNEDLFMLVGSDCEIVKDIPTAVYKTSW